MRILIADECLASLCENLGAGAEALTPRGYESMTLVLDLIAPETVTFQALETLASVGVEYDGHPATHVVIMTEYVRMTFRSVAYPSGDPVTFDPTNQTTAQSLQLLEVVPVGADWTAGRTTGGARI